VTLYSAIGLLFGYPTTRGCTTSRSRRLGANMCVKSQAFAVNIGQ
jgi:hypothetical protein